MQPEPVSAPPLSQALVHLHPRAHLIAYVLLAYHWVDMVARPRRGRCADE
jgi:hypothetical protein